MSDAYDLRKLIAETSIGILATLKKSGLPQMSPVTAGLRPGHLARPSVIETRILSEPSA